MKFFRPIVYVEFVVGVHRDNLRQVGWHRRITLIRREAVNEAQSSVPIGPKIRRINSWAFRSRVGERGGNRRFFPPPPG